MNHTIAILYKRGELDPPVLLQVINKATSKEEHLALYRKVFSTGKYDFCISYFDHVSKEKADMIAQDAPTRYEGTLVEDQDYLVAY